MSTSLSTADSAPHSSPGRPRSCRTAADGLGSSIDVNASLAGSNRTIGVGPEVGQPDDVALVDVHRVRLRIAARQAPLPPRAGRRVEHAELARVPLGDPQPPGRVGPHAARTLTGGRRLFDLGGAGRSGRCGPGSSRQATRTRPRPTAWPRCRTARGRAARRTPRPRRARIDAPVDAGLAGEPERPVAVERRRVQVRPAAVRRQREGRDCAARRVDPEDRVAAAVRDPGMRRPVRRSPRAARNPRPAGSRAPRRSTDRASRGPRCAGRCTRCLRPPRVRRRAGAFRRERRTREPRGRRSRARPMPRMPRMPRPTAPPIRAGGTRARPRWTLPPTATPTPTAAGRTGPPAPSRTRRRGRQGSGGAARARAMPRHSPTTGKPYPFGRDRVPLPPRPPPPHPRDPEPARRRRIPRGRRPANPLADAPPHRRPRRASPQLPGDAPRAGPAHRDRPPLAARARRITERLPRLAPRHIPEHPPARGRPDARDRPGRHLPAHAGRPGSPARGGRPGAAGAGRAAGRDRLRRGQGPDGRGRGADPRRGRRSRRDGRRRLRPVGRRVRDPGSTIGTWSTGGRRRSRSRRPRSTCSRP